MTEPEPHILLVEDDPVDREACRRAVTAALPDALISSATGLEQAREKLEDEPVDCIVTDCFLPDGTAIELLASHFLRLPPIVVVSGDGRLADAVQALKLGAADFIEKDKADPETLKEAIERAIRQRLVETQREARFVEHAWRSMYDELSGLPNRYLLRDRLELEVKSARREQRGLGVLMIDLNGFKEINDDFGHSAGDHAIRIISARLQGFARDSDTFARIGGDEFCALLPGIAGEYDLELVARRAAVKIGEPFTYGSHLLCVSAAIGGALFPRHGDDGQVVLEAADAAMYRAKRGGTEYVGVRSYADVASGD